jgi:hypothetical protein
MPVTTLIVPGGNSSANMLTRSAPSFRRLEHDAAAAGLTSEQLQRYEKTATGPAPTGCRVSMSRRRAVGRGRGPVSYLRAFASASSFSSWFTRSCSVDKRELNRPTLKNVTLLAGASRVLPYPSQDES